jgi:hypothetical protein
LKFQELTVNPLHGHTSITMPKRSSRLDMNQLAKRIVDEATGAEPITPPPAQKNQSAVERRGGAKGGIARAAKLTPEQRIDAARTAANARWKKAT